MSDHYLEDRTRLKGQPKKTIADYVEQNGMLVPRRFSSLNEARASGLPILVRSEHPQDYDGASDLLFNTDLKNVLEKSDITEENLKIELLKKEGPHDPKWYIYVYCSLLGLDESKFIDELSFSFWEKLSGYNRTVVADSSIKGRYHITTDIVRELENYTLFENGRILISAADKLTHELEERLKGLIELYEQIRNLDRFDKNHCPLLEIQTIDGKNYFLQYHRTRDFNQAKFELDRDPKDDELEALFVRGATSPKGIECKVTITNPDPNMLLRKYTPYDKWRLPEIEDGSFDNHYNLMFSEIMVRKRKIQIINGTSSESVLWQTIVKHISRSKLFKPEVSIVIDRNSIVSENEFSKIEETAKKTKENQYINLYVISDGRRAFVKRV